ncbi:uncharacterized protein TNCV_1503081 [Trichonephila clavipes]|uniref:Uncharacterized protein n=1 Tax=Trichonephila clavipes TaxID=2585209 RepID=A0A8X6RYE5_TRICX|nr:uncharacterized protein TNCV_1503081 [Trichonephila clavipes]
MWRILLRASINNQIKLLEIPTDLSCACLNPWQGSRLVFGSTLVQNTATEFAQLKAALTKNFPIVRNRKDLEIQLYESQQNRGQDPTDFIYDQLKIHKKLGLRMTEEDLVNHIFLHLEPQVQDYVEKLHGFKNSGNVQRRGWKESRSNHDDRQRNWKNLEVLHRPSNGRNNYRGNYESGRQRNQWSESRNERNRDDRRFDGVYLTGNRVQSENFSRGDRRNRGSSTNFSRGNQRQGGGRLNVLMVKDDENDQSQSVNEVPIKLSAI